ncbi:MAG: ATP-binding protein [Endomicrobium sp.]|jgi:Holliday junction resolvase-like predicted endonuclease|nr:ATP-binding protein [Endomicrobium sp.]
MKSLPIGIQSFSKLIKENKIYVDKTKYVYELVKNGNVFFLSRPRRFGKSLLISTFEELFNGNKNLFEGLYIYDKWNWEEKYPVIRLDFAELKYSSGQELNASIEKFLDTAANNAGISLERNADGLIPMKFAELIKKLHKAYGSQVVILIDEYDKPVTDNLSNKEVMAANKRILHDFYQVIKATDEHLKFVFLTGVSKFSGLSVFSALNSINDITVDERYSTICGYTQEELEEHFKDYITALSQKLNLTYKESVAAIKDWYNGYSWDGKISVYNPFSTLMLFDKKRFANYWFRTGTPTFLLDLIRQHNRPQNFLGELTASDSSFESYNPDNLNEIPLLFQTGYLTVKSIKSSIEGVEYTLNFPDREVKDSFLQCLLSNYTAYPQESMPELFKELSVKFQNADSKGLEDNLTALLAHIPYQLITESEKYYHSIFLIWLKTLGFDIQGEISTNRGRIDAVLKQNDYAVITEIKYSTEKALEEMLESALKQIDDKKYYEAYLEKKVILLAIAFNGKDVKCKFKTSDTFFV